MTGLTATPPNRVSVRRKATPLSSWRSRRAAPTTSAPGVIQRRARLVRSTLSTVHENAILKSSYKFLRFEKRFHLSDQKSNQTRHIVPYDTCVSFGFDTYRSFDGAVFNFHTRCGFHMVLHESKCAGFLRIQMHIVSCESLHTCKKVRGGREKKMEEDQRGREI